MIALRRLALLLLLALAAGVVVVVALAPRLAASRIRAMAHQRGLVATWDRFAFDPPARAELGGLVVRREASGDTVLVADRLDVALRPLALLSGHAQPARLELERARIVLGGSSAGVDTTADELDTSDANQPVATNVRARADALVRALLVPARSLPELHLHDVELSRGEEEGLTLSGLELVHRAAGIDLATTGTIHGDRDAPFDALLHWGEDDKLTGRAELKVGEAENGSPGSVVVLVDGRVSQDRRAREIRIAEGTKVTIGKLAAGVSGRVSAHGPSGQLELAADGLTGDAIRASLPAGVLGPLAGLDLQGSFDWHAGFDLDLSRPDSVRFHADVIPHGLALGPGSNPALTRLNDPFLAQIHLPHDRIVERDLSDTNPHFRPLAAISPYLRDAVLTNEDGGFWWHRGFNTEAIGLALAANLRSGTYKRGAGTITMQLARNLWLGHRRTLSRKAQEVALAWLLEHESGLSKERLLEIYLNIIEWGPDVHGADEAARYYFDEDAAQVSLDEALFLTIVVPSPTKWRYRLASDGTLRPFARAQMHFIAGKMAAKGWLGQGLVPSADEMTIRLRGPAAALFGAPPGVLAQSPDTSAIVPAANGDAEDEAAPQSQQPPAPAPPPAYGPQKKQGFHFPWFHRKAPR
jgi:hypothetical protein